MPPDARPLTQAQLGLWLSQQQTGIHDLYHTAERVRLCGELDTGRLTQAIEQTLGEAEGLHVVIKVDGEGPRQYQSDAPIPLLRVDLCGEADPESAARAWMDAALARPMDLANGPLVHQALLRLGETEHHWFLLIHHLLIDGFGFRLLQQRVAQLYREPNAPPAFAPLERLLAEESAYLESDRPAADQAFWAERRAGLAALPPRLGDSPPVYAARPIRVRQALPRALRAALVEQAARVGCQWTDWLFVAVALALHRHRGHHEIPLGVPVMGRLGSPAARVPALMMNLTLLRLPLPADTDACSLARSVAAELKACRAHQRYPYAELLRDLRASGGERPFSAVVNLLPFDLPLDFGSLAASPLGVSAGGHDDLVVSLRPDSDGFALELEGSPGVYEPGELAALGSGLMGLLTELGEAPERVRVATPSCTLLLGAPLTQAPEDVWARIRAQAVAAPHRPALIEGERRLTYGELIARVWWLAAGLQALGVAPGQRIGLLLPQGMDAICALLAVLAAGAAYVPLDTEAPAARRRAIIEDAGLAGLIRDDAIPYTDGGPPVWTWSELQDVALCRSPLAPAADPEPGPATWPELLPETPAYLIYTSGSTGRPKGVVIGRGALAHFTAAAIQAYRISAEDRVLHFAPLHFDASVEEIFCTLGSGATLVVRDDSPTRSLVEFTARLVDWGITLLDLPTAYWQEWCYALDQHGLAPPPALRGVIIGGEALHDEPRRRWFALPGAPTLWNSYGPSEATVVATLCRLDGPEDANSIGHPLPGVLAWVADEQGLPCAPGETGELVLGGPALALGYLGLPVQTAARFVTALALPGTPRGYRTGDRACIGPGGALSYLGRIDDEQKISGHRVVPSEIEAALLALPEVEQAAVMGVESAPGRRHLAAFLVGAEMATERLRGELAATLPQALIPSRITWLACLPKTSSGKIDRLALAALAAVRDPVSIADETPTERLVREVWGEVLGHRDFDRDADFFLLGGQSLQCLQVAVGLGAALGREVPVPLLFSHPRLGALTAALAAALAGQGGGGAGGPDSPGHGDLHWLEQAARGPGRAYAGRDHGCRRVLLTGATGFIGAALLAELLNDRRLEVHCLVRAQDAEAARERLRSVLGRQHIQVPASAFERLHLTVGDLAEPRLGLGPADWGHLSRGIDTIVANGATVSVMRDFQSLRGANLDGVDTLLALAAEGVPKRLLLVSTLATLPDASIAPIAESRRYPVHAGLIDGYQQTKWAAEQRVFDAIDQGLGAEVVRLGRVTSAPGAAPNAQDLLWRILASGLCHRRLPVLGFSEIWTPVDYVAATLAALLTEPRRGAVWHLTPWPSVALGDVYAWLRDAGYDFDELALPEWLAHLQGQGDAEDRTLAAFFAQREGAAPSTPGTFQPPPFDPGWHQALRPRAEPSPHAFHAALRAAVTSGLIPPPSITSL